MFYEQKEERHSDIIAIAAAVIFVVGIILGIILGMVLTRTVEVARTGLFSGTTTKQIFNIYAMLITWLVTIIISGDLIIMYWFLSAIENVNDTLQKMHNTFKDIDKNLPVAVETNE